MQIALVLIKDLKTTVSRHAEAFKLNSKYSMVCAPNVALLEMCLKDIVMDHIDVESVLAYSFPASHRFCIERKDAATFCTLHGARLLEIQGAEYAVGQEYILNNIATAMHDLVHAVEPLCLGLETVKLNLGARIEAIETSINIQSNVLPKKSTILSIPGSSDKCVVIENDSGSFSVSIGFVEVGADKLSETVLQVMTNIHDDLMENSEDVGADEFSVSAKLKKFGSSHFSKPVLAKISRKLVETAVELTKDEDEDDEIQWEIENLLSVYKEYKKYVKKNGAYLSVESSKDGYKVALCCERESSELDIAKVTYTDGVTKVFDAHLLEYIELDKDSGDNEIHRIIVGLILKAIK